MTRKAEHAVWDGLRGVDVGRPELNTSEAWRIIEWSRDEAFVGVARVNTVGFVPLRRHSVLGLSRCPPKWHPPLLSPTTILLEACWSP